MSNLTLEIWTRATTQEPIPDLTTAEGRAALDNRLRAELATIEDEHLRGHVAEMIRSRRRSALAFNDMRTDPQHLAERIAAIEAYLGLKPRPPFVGREITSLRPGQEHRP